MTVVFEDSAARGDVAQQRAAQEKVLQRLVAKDPVVGAAANCSFSCTNALQLFRNHVKDVANQYD